MHHTDDEHTALLEIPKAKVVSVASEVSNRRWGWEPQMPHQGVPNALQVIGIALAPSNNLPRATFKSYICYMLGSIAWVKSTWKKSEVLDTKQKAHVAGLLLLADLPVKNLRMPKEQLLHYDTCAVLNMQVHRQVVTTIGAYCRRKAYAPILTLTQA